MLLLYVLLLPPHLFFSRPSSLSLRRLPHPYLIKYQYLTKHDAPTSSQTASDQNFNQPLAFAQHCLSSSQTSRLAATDQVQKQRGMNFEKYPWLRDLSNPSDIPFLLKARQELGEKGSRRSLIL